MINFRVIGKLFIENNFNGYVLALNTALKT